MELLFYASRNEKNEKRLETAIGVAAAGIEIERFTRLDDLRDRLRDLVEPNSIAVLTAANREELLKLQAFGDMLTEIYIILVIPDRRKSTIKLAYFLKPRFLSSIKDHFNDLKQIIAKIVQSPRGTAAKPYNGGNPASTTMTRQDN